MSTTTEASAIERMGEGLANYIEKYFLSPFLFAIILMYLVYLTAIIVQGTGVIEIILF